MKKLVEYLRGGDHQGTQRLGGAPRWGKVTYLGWSTSQDQIPQATSIVLGRNLVKNSKGTSTKPTTDKEPAGEESSNHSTSSHNLKPQQPR
jgi:hypothetical protein